MKPLIGITSGMAFNVKNIDFSHIPQQYHQLSNAYTTAVEHAGGIPVILPCYENSDLVFDVISNLDGIIFSGGGDVDPRLFNSRALSCVTPIQPCRDRNEIALAEYVIRCTQMPVLGICRGMQVVNVALGGDLYTDLKIEGKLEHRMSMYPRYMPSHEIEVLDESRLFHILKGSEIMVNSYHHQAVKTVAEGMTATAWSIPDVVVEAMEMIGNRFVLMVQWHPEAMSDNKEHQEIFRTFVTEAKQYKEQRT